MTLLELIEDGKLTESQVFKAGSDLDKAFTLQGSTHFSDVWQALESASNCTYTDTEIIEEIADYIEGIR